ncbi:glutamate-5-semialdehyde dehydrogenase [Urechidicola croceus]|uniref:Gamma-glutamyl phosphate reductase n=1 Tax=Urechidicola croceus TaxID=1850246 RepID=A0A1D8PBP0_9FLAO|nr:glutamate-5-semialdehyde dehydrogenase [Urechidicola croceus]AOW21921.1 glutamate-5-semialdehyde dehydrogenase [Urechidicola croceus]
MKLLKTKIKNNVLKSMIEILNKDRNQIINANKKDLEAFKKEDQAMYDRLIVTDKKIDEMIQSIEEVLQQEDPVGKEKSNKKLKNGLHIINKTSPFGTIMIIYESRPDVTIEAAVLAFKANNKILLKGGKEAFYSNEILVHCWHKALSENNLSKDWIEFLFLNRNETQEFLKNPTQKLDLIVPRGGENLISFVKKHATCNILISGRGNNFLYISENADWDKTIQIILNAKIQKISACNALDKILINPSIENYQEKLKELNTILNHNNVEVLVDKNAFEILPQQQLIVDNSIWHEEFLAMKCCIGTTNNLNEAIQLINEYSGGHSATIMTTNTNEALEFMNQVDSAAVYHNASTRFTDGGQMGVGAELAISTDKLHHRGPLGLEQLVTNKYYIFGDGQVRT